jgi:uncharacterized protein
MTDTDANVNQKNRRIFVEYVIVAAILIVTSFTPYKLAGMLIVIAYLFLEAIFRKRSMDSVGFNRRELPRALKATWPFLVLVVLAAPLVTVLIGKLFLPEYFAHVLSRVTPYLDLSSMTGLFVQLLVLALGEEIVFRAFLQGRLSLFIDARWAILFSAFVFAALHFTPGAAVIVTMDLLSVFVDGLLYGLIFRRSNNVYASTVAHYLANSFGILLLLFISRGL